MSPTKSQTLFVRVLIASAFLFSTLIVALGQSGREGAKDQPSYKCEVESSYDRFADTTILLCPLLKFKPVPDYPATLYVNVIAEHKGRALAEPIRFSLHFSYSNYSDLRPRRPLYGDAQTLYVLTDKARLELAADNYKFQDTSVMALEGADVGLSREDIEKLITAKSIEARWGRTEMSVSDQALEHLRDFLEKTRR